MPFDLEQTIHIFKKLDNGGLQQVVTKEGADTSQVLFIQTHLSQEAEKFRVGDFSDPAQIHGEKMPGLAILRERANEIDVQFTTLDNGAQLEYISEDSDLIAAIHAWFDAQLSDHSMHATDAIPPATPVRHIDTTVSVVMPLAGAIWIANEKGDSLTVVNAATNAVAETLTGIPGPHNVQVSPDGQTVWAVSGHENLVVAVDAQSFSLLGMTPVGNAPAHVVISPDGVTAFVTNSDDNTVTVLDTTTFAVQTTIPVGAFPHGLRVSPDGQWVAVANLRGDSISLIDTAALTVGMTIAVGAGPVQVAFAPDGDTLYVTLNSEDAVAAVNLETQTVTGKAIVGDGPVQVHVTSDGSLVLVANQGAEDKPGTTLSLVEAANMIEVGIVETGRGAHGVVVEPSGRYAYVTNLYDNTMAVVDLAARQVVATVPTGTSPNGVSFSLIAPPDAIAVEVDLSLPTHDQEGEEGQSEGNDAHH